jgi:Icc-related predicted phosphoesterase
MKIVMISDTHSKHRMINDLPDGDLLIHAGDFSVTGTYEEVFHFNNWLGEIKHKYKNGIVLICGNHELTFCPSKKQYSPYIKGLITNATYLENSGVEIEGIKIFGSPIQPEFYDWGFNRKRGDEIRAEWNKIPEDTEILIVHGPPYGIGDNLPGYKDSVGCKDLTERIEQLPNIKLVVFGHIHSGYGVKKHKEVTYVNASILDNAYKMKNEPIIVTYLKDGILV